MFKKMNAPFALGLLVFVASITGEMMDKKDGQHFIEKRALIKADCKGCVDLCLWRFHCEMCWKASCDQSGCTCKPISGGCQLTNGCQNVIKRVPAPTVTRPKRFTLS